MVDLEKTPQLVLMLDVFLLLCPGLQKETVVGFALILMLMVQLLELVAVLAAAVVLESHVT